MSRRGFQVWAPGTAWRMMLQQPPAPRPFIMPDDEPAQRPYRRRKTPAELDALMLAHFVGGIPYRRLGLLARHDFAALRRVIHYHFRERIEHELNRRGTEGEA
jgi:hypothetical protein